VVDKDAVLIVDDDPALLHMAGAILQELYAVSFAKSGYEMLSLFETDYLPDIILLDIDMPGFNGFDALARLRETEDARDIPVIYLTGAARLESELKGLAAGAVDYITKPFVRELLLARLKIHLDNGKRLRQLSMIEKTKLESGLDRAKFEALAKGLNDTERKALRLVALGYTNKEISTELYYSYGYIKKVVSIIFEKIGFSKRSEIQRYFQ
jgi:DNA-binding response OmpR family regulator